MKSLFSSAKFSAHKKDNHTHITRALVLGAVFASACTVTAFAQKGVVNADNVNIRTAADPDSSIIGFANTGDEAEVTSLVGDYYQVTINGEQNLYIHTEFLDVDGSDITAPIEENGVENSSAADDVYAANNTYAIVHSDDGLNMRSAPNLDSDVIFALPDGAAVNVLESWPVWTKVDCGGTVGYMKTEYVELHKGQAPKQIMDNGIASNVIAYGKKFLGTPYVWGGTNLSRGVDCSGFVYSVYNHFGIHLDRSSISMGSDGVRVSKANLQMGDLVLFDTSGANNGHISHVGIYIGNGQFIHSSSSKRQWGVSISSLGEAYYQRTYVTARRVI
jgi:cell wall-associated NlpC family hydrolase